VLFLEVGLVKEGIRRLRLRACLRGLFLALETYSIVADKDKNGLEIEWFKG